MGGARILAAIALHAAGVHDGTARIRSVQDDGPRVVASRRELRLVFPLDTAHVWGWSAAQAAEYRGYRWSADFTTAAGRRLILLDLVPRDGAARRFRSLAAVVSADTPRICTGAGWIVTCDNHKLLAEVEHGSVVISVRDSAVIAMLLGLRPAYVELWRVTPSGSISGRGYRVPVEYRSPDIPAPDSALLAQAEAARRNEAAMLTSITRYIASTGAQRDGASLRVSVGDSAGLRVDEMRCHSDVCSSGMWVALADSGWAVEDSSIASIHPNRSKGSSYPPPQVYLVGKRRGATKIRVRGVHGGSDTIPARTPVASVVEREVIVQ